MSDFEKLKEELPSKRKFYDYLAGKNLSSKESKHTLNVWKKSANVFKKFRNNSIKNYGKYLSHYLSAPGLS